MADEVKKVNAEVIAVYPDKIKIVVDKKIEQSTIYIASNFFKNTGINAAVATGNKQDKNAIALLVDEKISLPNDGYLLTVNKKGVIVKGKTANGVLNGFQTLMQICTAKEVQKGTIPFVKINGQLAFFLRNFQFY